MKPNKTSRLLIAVSSLFLLVGCAKDDNPSDTYPDVNKFDQVLSVESGKQWVMNSYNKMNRLDGVQVTTDIPAFSYKDVYTKKTQSPNTLPVTNLSIDASLKQEINILGLTRNEPNDIEIAYSANDIFCSLSKTGINPLKDDIVSMNNGAAEMYVKDNKQYVNKSNQNVKDFFPYIMYGFMDEYETIDQAKQEAEKVPDKFFDPTPVFKKEDLPLNKKLTSFKGITFETIFNQLIKTNDSMEEENKFLTFKTNGEDMMMSISLGKYHIGRILYAVTKLMGKDFSQQDIDDALKFTLYINALEFEFVFGGEYLLDYTNFDVDFSLFIPDGEKGPDGKISNVKGTYNYVMDFEAHSIFNFANPYVRYPRDLNKYQEYDIKYPEIKPNTGTII